MFLGADLPPGRPSSAAEGKGRRSRGSAATRSTPASAGEHGENPPFDRREHRWHKLVSNQAGSEPVTLEQAICILKLEEILKTAQKEIQDPWMQFSLSHARVCLEKLANWIAAQGDEPMDKIGTH